MEKYHYYRTRRTIAYMEQMDYKSSVKILEDLYQLFVGKILNNNTFMQPEQ